MNNAACRLVSAEGIEAGRCSLETNMDISTIKKPLLLEVEASSLQDVGIHEGEYFPFMKALPPRLVNSLLGRFQYVNKTALHI